MVGLDDVVGALEPDADLVARAVAPAPVVDRHRRVLAGPGEERVRLATVHVLLEVEHDNVVVQLHLVRDAARVPLLGAAEDELDLHVVSGSAGCGVDRLRVRDVGRADELAALERGVDGEDANKDVDGRERVGERVRERPLLLAELAPLERLLVRAEHMYEESRHRCGKAAEEQEREQDRERLRRHPRLAQ